ncbi:MAG: TetR/AcrR family transcriptional regulator [Lachnospiraceae bacterium]|nr:TetR/AcrR family transcriptional regulator [Lachnospiraceae bacterium]
MDTKRKIVEAALKLFAEKGYSDVYVGDIAKAVGIKAPSLYKHFKGKQEIFDAILEVLKESYAKQAVSMGINGDVADVDADVYAGISEDTLVEMGKNFFLYFLHDEYMRLFRKLLTIEQFHNSELGDLYTKQYMNDPLVYQGDLFGILIAKGRLMQVSEDVLAMQFYAPIYMWLTECDRHPDREADALRMIEAHIRQFNHNYLKEDES